MKPHVTPETMTPQQLGEVLLQFKRRIEYLEDMLSHTIVLLLEARGAITRPDDDHVSFSEKLIETAVEEWYLAHERSRKIEQELRDERN